jgi:hypothetical protein
LTDGNWSSKGGKPLRSSESRGVSQSRPDEFQNYGSGEAFGLSIMQSTQEVQDSPESGAVFCRGDPFSRHPWVGHDKHAARAHHQVRRSSCPRQSHRKLTNLLDGGSEIVGRMRLSSAPTIRAELTEPFILFMYIDRNSPRNSYGTGWNQSNTVVLLRL